jgi:hypothetical protein
MITKLETVVSGAIYIACGGFISYSAAKMTAQQLKFSYDAYMDNIRKYLKIKHNLDIENDGNNSI